MHEQLDLFQENTTVRFAVIICSCIMEDQFGEVWHRVEKFKENLSEDDAKYLTASLNQSLDLSQCFYKTIPMLGPNYLIP